MRTLAAAASLWYTGHDQMTNLDRQSRRALARSVAPSHPQWPGNRRAGGAGRRAVQPRGSTVSWQSSLVVAAIAVVAGTLGSILGLGGGVFLIPALTLLLGVDMHQAMGASLVAVIATSTGAAAGYVRERLANLRLASFLELATTSGALVGALIAAHVPARTLFFFFAVLLFYSAYGMFQRRNVEVAAAAVPDPVGTRLGLHGSYFDGALGRSVAYAVANVPAGFAVMWLAGITSGVLGIGSGLLKVLGMDTVMRLPIKVSSATSNLMVGVTAAASAGYFFARGLLTPELAAPVALGVLAGSYVGRWWLSSLRGQTLRRLFIPVLLYVGAQMLQKGLRG